MNGSASGLKDVPEAGGQRHTSAGSAADMDVATADATADVVTVSGGGGHHSKAQGNPCMPPPGFVSRVMKELKMYKNEVGSQIGSWGLRQPSQKGRYGVAWCTCSTLCRRLYAS